VKSSQFRSTPFADDGFGATAAEPWILQKVSILQQYLTVFVATLAGQVDDIILVDLYSGNGLYSLGANRELFPGAAMAALGTDLPINKFVLCEKDSEQSRILKIRVNKHFRSKNIVLLEGRPEDLIDKFRLYVPQSKGSYRTAILCICDPFSLEIPFATIDLLADQGFSFIIPFTFALNERINHHHYRTAARDRLKRFMGGYKDVERLERGLENNVQFYKRLVRMYETNMLALGLNASRSIHKIDSALMEVPAYTIGFFSRQFSVQALQHDVLTARSVQYTLFEEHEG
jgi:three-Cys-motif partner protein